MYFVYKIYDDNVLVGNTEDDSLLSITPKNLALCVENTGLRVYGVDCIPTYKIERYKEIGKLLINVSARGTLDGSYYQSTSRCYLIEEFDADILPDVSLYDRYEKYMLKCKLAGKRPNIYVKDKDDLSRTIDSIGFLYDDSVQDEYESGIIKVPSIVTYINFNALVLRKAYRIIIPSSCRVIFSIDKLNAECSIRAPKELYTYLKNFKGEVSYY